MRTLRHAALALSVAGAGLSAAPSAEAAFTYTMAQVGADVVATGTGTLNVAALTQIGNWDGSALLPSDGLLATGAGVSDFPANETFQGVSGPGSFGPGGINVSPASYFGSAVFIQGSGGQLGVPEAYVSGQPLSTGATFTSASYASLGLTPGTYTWTWGVGDTADILTLQIVSPTLLAPEPVTGALLGAALFGLGIVRRVSGLRTCAD